MTTEHDPINHPKHYAAIPADVECIDIARHLPYNLGCAFKYVWRAGEKDITATNEDLDKAVWYINDYMEHFGKVPYKSVAALAVWETVRKRDNEERAYALDCILIGDYLRAITAIQMMKKVV